MLLGIGKVKAINYRYRSTSASSTKLVEITLMQKADVCRKKDVQIEFK